MDIDTQLLTAAEHLFDRDGFNATGMGRLVEATGLSSRTIYKHASGKNALMARVLTARAYRFFASVRFDDVDALFNGLKHWLAVEGTRGCLFFRLQAETGGRIAEIEQAVVAYHDRLRTGIDRLVIQQTGHPDPCLSQQLLALFEGATTVATYGGIEVVEAARAAAHRLLRVADRCPQL